MAEMETDEQLNGSMEASQETSSANNTYIPPSVCHTKLLNGESYAYYSPCPSAITPSTASTAPETKNEATACVLGIDEAGRGPVLGPMVYSAYYLPIPLHRSLLADDYSFDDSKVLTPEVRSRLMREICTESTPLHTSCGWAVKVLSARDISSGMLRPTAAGNYNLNAQAIDATVEIIRGVVEQRGIDVKEVYIDTIGKPEVHQARIEQIFPGLKITVAKRADSLYPCVSAASVCAKVTRDAALEVCYSQLMNERLAMLKLADETATSEEIGWGSGYPSDPKCSDWLRKEMDSLFGWGTECRFSWATAKDMLDTRAGLRVDWPVEADDNASLMTQYFTNANPGADGEVNELRDWYGQRPKEIF